MVKNKLKFFFVFFRWCQKYQIGTTKVIINNQNDNKNGVTSAFVIVVCWVNSAFANEISASFYSSEFRRYNEMQCHELWLWKSFQTSHNRVRKIVIFCKLNNFYKSSCFCNLSVINYFYLVQLGILYTLYWWCFSKNVTKQRNQ